MKLSEHIGVSFALSTIIFALSKNRLLAFSSFLSGTLIDFDHFFDYFKSAGIRLDLNEFFSRCENLQFEKIYVLFHSYELLLFLLLLAYFTSYNIAIVGTLLGFSQHLLLDQVFNRVKPFGYFLIHRWQNNFLIEYVFNDNGQQPSL